MIYSFMPRPSHVIWLKLMCLNLLQSVFILFMDYVDKHSSHMWAKIWNKCHLWFYVFLWITRKSFALTVSTWQTQSSHWTLIDPFNCFIWADSFEISLSNIGCKSFKMFEWLPNKTHNTTTHPVSGATSWKLSFGYCYWKLLISGCCNNAAHG